MSSLTSQPNEDLASRCPEAVSLRSFLDGRLSDEQCDTIALHLESCATCLAAITELEQTNASRQPSEKFPEAGSSPEDSDGLARAVARAIDSSSVAPLAESRFQIGMVVGSYRLVQRLGSGGMGVVFLAEHETMRRRVALKVLVGRLQDDPESTRRFVHEIRTSAKLAHPRFVKSLDAGEFDGSPYLVMDYLEGVSLATVSHSWGRLSVADACEIARQIAEGLQVLADNKLVHRDLKPSNVMLVPESSTGSARVDCGPTVKILDFGVARWRESAGMTQAVTLPSLVVGTLEYMAPEQVEASSQVDERADCYSLGATLFKLLIGAAPLELSGLADASPFAKATHLKTESVPPIRSLRRDVPRAVARIVDRLLSRDPAQRPSPSEVQRTLAAFAVDADLPRLVRELPESPCSLPKILPRTNRLRNWTRSLVKNLRWLVAAVMLLLGAVVYATNYGDLSIEVLDEDTKVVVSRGGNLIEVIDTREKRRVRLRPDKYELAIENSDKHTLKLSTNQVTIRRGATEIARVKLQPNPEATPKIEPASKLTVAPRLPAGEPLPRFSEDFDAPRRDWLVERKSDLEFGFRNGCYFIQSPVICVNYLAWGSMPVWKTVDVELIGRTVECPNGAWGLRVENQLTPKDGFYVGVTGNRGVVINVFNEPAVEQPVTVNVKGQKESLSMAQPLRIRSLPSIRPMGEFNTLRIRVDHRTVHVLVNGERVCEPFTLPRAISPVALYLAVVPDGPPGVNAEFDRVRLWRADAAPELP